MGIQENLGMDPPQGRTGRKILRGHYSFQYLPKSESHWVNAVSFQGCFPGLFWYLEPGSVKKVRRQQIPRCLGDCFFDKYPLVI